MWEIEDLGAETVFNQHIINMLFTEMEFRALSSG